MIEFAFGALFECAPVFVYSVTPVLVTYIPVMLVYLVRSIIDV